MHRVMIHPASYDNCAAAVDLAFENFPLEIAGKKVMIKPNLLRPVADPEFCTACGACVDHCPVSALEIQDTFPVVEADTCITCFCCQEICPEKAITLQ